jgi:hypothetical protein
MVFSPYYCVGVVEIARYRMARVRPILILP